MAENLSDSSSATAAIENNRNLLPLLSHLGQSKLLKCKRKIHSPHGLSRIASKMRSKTM